MGGSNNLPKVARVGRLDTLVRIRREMERKYKQSAAGLILVADLPKFIYALREITEVIWKQDVGEKVLDLYKKADRAGLLRPQNSSTP